MPSLSTPPGEVVDPGHSIYPWYEATAQFIQQMRASAGETGTCPRCGGAGTLHDDVRSINCTQCDLRASVASLHAWEPKEFHKTLQRRLDSIWCDLAALKADVTYRNADGRAAYDALQSKAQIVELALETLRPLLGRRYILLASRD